MGRHAASTGMGSRAVFWGPLDGTPNEHGVDLDVDGFARDGFTVVRGLVSADEVDGLAQTYERFLNREIAVQGRDYCDMAGDYQRAPEAFDVLNVMLPRRYHPEWCGNVYERRALGVARALAGEDLVLDYDQLVAKPPGRPGAVFHWHQDLAYWPMTEDTRTVTLWLALDRAAEDNGCVRFVPGTHLEEELRPHAPLHGDRDRSHTLVAEMDERAERVVAPTLEPGDALAFSERVLHGSGGNTSSRWRRGYVLAHRSAATVAQERELGFTHSHEDHLDVLRSLTRDPTDPQ